MPWCEPIAWRSTPCGRGRATFPVGLTLSMDEMVADPGGEDVLEAAQEILEDRFMRATEGDDFIGVQCYSRVHFGPEGQAPNEPGRPAHPDGLRVLAAGSRALRPAGRGHRPGMPVLLTESGIATDDDTERITYHRRGPARSAARPR